MRAGWKGTPRAEGAAQGAVRVDAAPERTASPDAGAPPEALGEPAYGAANLVDLGVGEGGKRRCLGRVGRARERCSARLVRTANVSADVVAGPLELPRERVGERLAASAERLDEVRAERSQRVARPRRAELVEEAMGEEPELESAVGVERARETREGEGSVEVRAATEEDAEGGGAIDSGRRELLEEGAQRGDLVGGEAEDGEAVPEREPPRPRRGRRDALGGGEERVERRFKPGAVAGAGDDDGAERVAHDGAVLEADGADRARRVNRLRRRDHEAVAAERPEELVKEARERRQAWQGRGHSGNLARTRAGAAAAGAERGGAERSGQSVGAGSARSVRTMLSRRASSEESYPTATSRTTPRLSMTTSVGKLTTP